MTPLIINTPKWKEYTLIDSGQGWKLERFSTFYVSRPEPQALWPKNLSNMYWENADATFLPTSSTENLGGKGKWSFKSNLPTEWIMSFDNIKFYAKPTPFRHLGFFPDQSPHWLWIKNKILQYNSNKGKKHPPKVLNLFGYSGVASIYAAINGAIVTHVDSSKKAISYAFENRNLNTSNNIQIRYITDDAIKFVNREIRRKNKYDAIILDPPKFGRGPNGEKWELNIHLPMLLNLIPQILTKSPLFIVLNCYAIRSSFISLHYALAEVMGNFKGKIESGEIVIKEDHKNPREICTAIFARWEK